MPLFIDHVGLNTLIHDDLDLTTNTRTLFQRRRVIRDRALRSSASGTDSRLAQLDTFAGLPTTGPMTIAFWMNLDENSAASSYNYIASATNSSDAETWSLYFIKTGSDYFLNFAAVDNSGNAKNWVFNTIDYADLTKTGWRFVYLVWTGNFSNNPTIFLDTVEHTSSSSTGSGTGTTRRATEKFALFDNVNGGTRPLDGSLQSFGLWAVSSSGNQTTLYNNGAPLNEGLPNISNLVNFWQLGSELETDELIRNYADGGEQSWDLAEAGQIISTVTIRPTFGTLGNNTLTLGGAAERSLSFSNGVINGTDDRSIANNYVGYVGYGKELAAINTHRNGPYGYSSWRQLRTSQNPITQNHRSTNTMTFVTQPGPIRNLRTEGELRTRDRYSALYSYTEPAVAQKAYPLVWNVGRHFKDDDGNIDFKNPHRFSIISSYGNEQIAFANEKVSRLHNFDPDEEQTEYVAIKDMYLEDGLNKQDSPLTHWEFIQYRETVFPKATQQYVSQARTRPQFSNFYRHRRSDRTLRPVSGNAFGYDPYTQVDFYGIGNSVIKLGFQTIITEAYSTTLNQKRALAQSSWPLDESFDFVNRDHSVTGTYNMTGPITFTGSTGDDLSAYEGNMGSATPLFRLGEGQLMSTTSQFFNLMSTKAGASGLGSSALSTVQTNASYLDLVMGPTPLYARRTSLHSTRSVNSRTGMEIPETGSSGYRVSKGASRHDNGNKLFLGGALWEAGAKRQVRNADGTYTSAAKQPFYDTYESYVEDVRKYGKNYSIIPEFRMSTQVADYMRTDGEIELDMFDVQGGTSGSSNSSETKFYEIYSNTDFMRNFEVIADDHKDFTNGKVLSLRCKAIKKFLPYEGFYPCQRTVDLAKQFYDSYKNDIKLYNKNNVEVEGFNYGRQNVLTPLFAPGVLFNTIKSGVAVDFPIVTDVLRNPEYLFGINTEYMIKNDFDKRVPFEALIEPAKYLAGEKIGNLEPHPSGNMSASAEWGGEGDNLYPMMANNFLAESISFFLPNGQLSSVVSKKQKDISLTSGSVYGMRVKMRRSMKDSDARGSVYHFNSSSFPYMPPQDVATGSLNESFTMYSRPSAFGPPSLGWNFTDALVTGTSPIGDQQLDTTDAVLHLFEPISGSIDTLSFTGPPGAKIASVEQFDSITGYNFPYTPPYYHGEGWCHITFTASSNSMTIKEIQEASSYEYTRFDSSFILITSSAGNGDGIIFGTSFNGTGPQAWAGDNLNKNAVQLSASINLQGVGTIRTRSRAGTAGSLVVDTALGEENRWVIQSKFETPMLNFNHVTAPDHLTLPTIGSESVPRGMWHQYGRLPEENEGVFLQVGQIPANYQAQVMGKITGSGDPATGLLSDMADALGFSGNGTKLGRIAQRKEISEAVVAIPFIEEAGRKKFFRIDREKVDIYKEGPTEENKEKYDALFNGPPSEQIGRSVLRQLEKMDKYIFPPSFDFINFETDKVKPIAMYIFEFSHTLTQTDLQDIWQNLPPDIGTEMEVSEVAITHPLLKKELLGSGGEGGNTTIEMPDKLKWMVFKVKQRAANNYFKKTVLRNPNVNSEADSGNVTQDEFGNTSTIQYNWPYDYFSLVEMVRVDAEVEMGNFNEEDLANYVDHIPSWSPVQADPAKIIYVVGGLEVDPIADAFDSSFELPDGTINVAHPANTGSGFNRDDDGNEILAPAGYDDPKLGTVFEGKEEEPEQNYDDMFYTLANRARDRLLNIVYEKKSEQSAGFTLLRSLSSEWSHAFAAAISDARRKYGFIPDSYPMYNYIRSYVEQRVEERIEAGSAGVATTGGDTSTVMPQAWPPGEPPED